MDTFAVNGPLLNDSLSKLSSINTILGNTSITLNAVIKVLQKEPEKKFHIVDIGCGAGDNLRAIDRWCSKNSRKIKLTGIDANEHILDYAKSQKSNGGITYKQADILDHKFELETCDILISSHFIYRFKDAELVDFVNKASKKVNNSIIFSELQRHFLPYLMFSIFGRLLFFNTMVLQDGLKAIKNSFQKKELSIILEKLQIKSYRLKWKWAFRYLIIIKL